MLNKIKPEQLPQVEVHEPTGTVRLRGMLMVADVRRVAVGGYIDGVTDKQDLPVIIDVAETARLCDSDQLRLPAPKVQLLGETATSLLEGYKARRTRWARLLGRLSTTGLSARRLQDQIAPLKQDIERLATKTAEPTEETVARSPGISCEFSAAAERSEREITDEVDSNVTRSTSQMPIVY